jgi:hypothetical protein
VYRIPCECGLVHIGETGRNLSCAVRLKEHKANCEKAEQDKSAVAKHIWIYDHRIKWDKAIILAIEVISSLAKRESQLKSRSSILL